MTTTTVSPRRSLSHYFETRTINHEIYGSSPMSSELSVLLVRELSKEHCVPTLEELMKIYPSLDWEPERPGTFD